MEEMNYGNPAKESAGPYKVSIGKEPSSKSEEALKSSIEGFAKSMGIFTKNISKTAEAAAEAHEKYLELQKEVEQSNEDLAKQKAQLISEMAEAQGDKLDELKRTFNEITEQEGENKKKLAAADAEAAKAQKKAEQERAQQLFDNIGNAIAEGIKALTSGIKSTIDKVMSTQAIMSYNLIGTGKTLAQASGNLSAAINGHGIVKQEDVYNKLKSLITSGIVYNAESRAYLGALSDELEMGFSVEAQGLTRLINLQREDLTLNRMSIQDSLKTFLNQNYQTSQYIKEGFQTVAESLLEAQSFMESRSAIQLESTVQKWLGSLSSLGMSTSTITSLAQAIGKLGSGNLSALSGDKMQTLMILGASRTGQDYAEMLTNGVNAQNAEELMKGIVLYLSEVAGRESNVVKSAFTDLLGISFSDLKAITNMGTAYPQGSLNTTGTGFGGLFNKVDSSYYLSTQLHNILENLQWSTGADIASSSAKYLLYKGIDLISNMVGGVLKGTTATIGFMGNGVHLDLGKIAEMVPEVLLASMAVPQMTSGLFNAIGGLFGGQAASIYRRLTPLGSRMITSAGSFNILSGGNNSQGGSSGSVIFSDAGDTEILDSAKTSGKETGDSFYDEEDEDVSYKTYRLLGGDDAKPNTIFSLLSVIAQKMEEFPSKTWEISTTPKLSKVSIGSTPGDPGEDVMGATYKCIFGIYTLLEAYLSSNLFTGINDVLTSKLNINEDMSGFLSGNLWG